MFLEGSEIVYPDVPHEVLVRKVDNEEFVVPVVDLKLKFGEHRYTLISSGRDPEFTSYPCGGP